MEQLTDILINYGLTGLIIAAFTEAFISPILPDFILIPLAMADPENAIYYGLVATLFSIIGGLVGYMIGYKFGVPAARKIISPKHYDKIHRIVSNNSKWAIFLAALSPIPYKFVSITAGIMKISLPVFIIISVIARAKRFLLEGLLIYYYGPAAAQLLDNYSDNLFFITLSLAIIGVLSILVFKQYKKNKNTVVT